jgi:Lipoxygenase.
LVSPHYAKVTGMRGLTATGDEKQPFVIDNVQYLIKVIAQIIYIAGPQHASVNYAQYPLMSYMPSVAGTIYQPAPGQKLPRWTQNKIA